MFEPTSRYANIETVSTTLADGREVTYVRRRFLPQPSAFTDLGQVSVEATDQGRIDGLAARTIGDPEQFWRLCDANLVDHPDELTATLGRSVRIASLSFEPGGGTP